jgi:hypothetical protein
MMMMIGSVGIGFRLIRLYNADWRAPLRIPCKLLKKRDKNSSKIRHRPLAPASSRGFAGMILR